MTLLWIVLGLLGVLVVLYLALVIGLNLFATPFEGHTPFILAEGKPFKCWVMWAQDQLYQGVKAGDLPSCTVVFADAGGADADEKLQRIAKALPAFRAAPDAPEQERLLSRLMEAEDCLHEPVPLPKRISEGLKAYVVALQIPAESLPEARLTRPYIYCKVLFEGKHAGARMIEYPAGE